MAAALNTFVIDSAESASLASASGLSSVFSLLPSLVPSAQPLARPPISNYPVAAVALSSDGRIFIGVNLEFPGLPLHHSVHAEQFMIANAALHGASRIDYIAVSSAPCGHCRQFLQEIRGAHEIQILITSDADADAAFRPLSDLLPHRFGPDDLLGKEAPLLMEPRDNGLALGLPDPEEKRIGHCNGDSRGARDWEELKRSALEAANRAHAPYSRCPSGAAVMDSKGRVFSGSYVESAAYNPSLMPLQAALVAYVARSGGGRYEEIVAAALVEKEEAAVGQEATARMVLRSVAPDCDFRAFRCMRLDGKKTPVAS
ncbi:hypothetical protein ACLOJK_037795 [Asimina triloba]